MVIDELIVVLGLDARQFTEGQRQALDAFKKGKEGAVEFGNRIEESAAKMSEAFGVVRKGALGIIGALAGGEAASFINHVVTMDAATGRMAKTIGTSVQNLSAWQYMIKQVGGEAGSATSALSTLQQEIENVRQGGGMFEGGFASLMNQAGVSITDNADASLRKIQAFIAGQITSGGMRPEEAATFLRRVPGMNQDMINLMLDDFRKIEAAANQAGTATRETADAAAALQGKFSLMIQSMERFGASMIPVIELMMKPTGEITKDDFNKIPGANSLFTRGGFMDWLDQKIWGDHNMVDAKKRLAEGLKSGAGGGTGSYGSVIAGIESGGRYDKVGPVTASGDRAYGKYQVMGANIPSWTQEALGRSMTPAEFLASPAAQDAVFNAKFGAYAKKYGPSGAAAAWFAGEGGMNNPGARDALGTSVSDYVGRFDRSLGAAGSADARVNNSRTSTSSSEVNQTNNFNIQATDPSGTAKEVRDTLQRQSMIAPANSAMV